MIDNRPMEIETKVSEQYDYLAEIYDRRWHSYVTKTLILLKEYLNLSGNEVILDVACGTGELERMLVNDHPNLQITGVDISAKMLDVARSKFPSSDRLQFLKASVNSLPFKDSSFDIVVTASAFHYFDYPTNALNEMRRVLKPNGKLIVMDWCRDFWFCQLLDLYLKVVDPAHKKCYTQQELNNFMGNANFQITDEKRTRPHLLWEIMIATGII